MNSNHTIKNEIYLKENKLKKPNLKWQKIQTSKNINSIFFIKA